MKSSSNGKIQYTNLDKREISETRSADSHTHGDASLAIVLEGASMTVELDTPLYNLLGFEHVAETAAQKAVAAKAKTALSDASSLFVFNKEAGCTASGDTASVNLELESHGEDDHDHHADDHTKDDGKDETHKDVILQYAYNCQNPKALKNVTVHLFEHFENLTELDLVYLGPNTQKQEKLSATTPRTNLTR